MVPMIGSICKGSLGVCQLGRTWWKTLTRAVGLLDESYPDNSGGLDTWCLEAMELDVDETYDYLRAELPDYVGFERWILEKKNGRLPAAKVARFNEIIRYRRHIRPHKITETYADIGFDPKVHTYTSALLLNTLQDWHLFHANDFLAAASDVPGNMPPLVDSLDVGPLNVMQLGRTWYKVLLEAKGLLNSDYPACGGGLDQGVLDALGLDRDETLVYIREQLPTYMDFESWVIKRIGEVDRAKVEAFETFLLNRQHAEAKRTGIHELTSCDPSITNGVLLNHLEDWRYAYDAAIVPRK
jgi:hypothetical protein